MRDSAIFLFRDLVTQRGDTIRLHLEKIDGYGYCWWGWWKKPIEDVPSELLSGLTQTARNPAGVFLFDCGQHIIYKADLLEVAISPSADGMFSPQINATPGYYAHLRLVVWIKLSSIKEVPKEDTGMVLETLTYAGFPTWPSPLYDRYKGNRVSSTTELDEMLVTLWHVRVGT